MLCSKCGKETSDEYNFCGYCGTKFTLLPGFLLKKQIELKRLSDENTKRKKLQEERWKQQEKEGIEKIEKEREEKERKKKEQEELERQEKEKQDQVERRTVAELLRTLSPKDYIVLESLRRDDWQLSLKLGTMELMAITEKLFRCGLIKRLDREPTFDEKEKLLKFMDSPAYKQHAKRIEQLATPEFKERVKAYMKKLGFESEYDLTELTGKGKELLNKKIKELKSEWGKLVAIYKTKDGKKLKQEIDNYRFDFPMMLYMGFSSGFIMSSMFNSLGIGMGGYLAEDPMMSEPLMGPIVMELEGFEKSPITYEQFMESWEKDGYYDENGNWVDTSSDGSTDSGDSGGGEGGFMDDGMEVGF